MNKFILLIASVFILVSCEKKIKLSTDYEGDLLVLNATVVADKINANLSHTGDLNGDIIYFDSLLIRNGTISLYQGNDIIGALDHTGNGEYEINGLELQEEVPYLLKASAPGHEDVQSDPFYLLPSSTVIDITAEQIDNIYGNPDTDAVLINIDFEDAHEGTNYYYCRVWGKQNGRRFNNFLTGYGGELGEVCNIENYPFFYGTVIPFSDKCFELSTFSLEVLTEIEGYKEDGYVYFDKLVIDFGLIDEHFYNFIIKRYQPEGLESALVEPYYQLSNIQGGYGHVVSSNIKSYVVDW